MTTWWTKAKPPWAHFTCKFKACSVSKLWLHSWHLKALSSRLGHSGRHTEFHLPMPLIIIDVLFGAFASTASTLTWYDLIWFDIHSQLLTQGFRWSWLQNCCSGLPAATGLQTSLGVSGTLEPENFITKHIQKCRTPWCHGIKINRLGFSEHVRNIRCGSPDSWQIKIVFVFLHNNRAIISTRKLKIRNITNNCRNAGKLRKVASYTRVILG